MRDYFRDYFREHEYTLSELFKIRDALVVLDKYNVLGIINDPLYECENILDEVNKELESRKE